MPNTLVHLGVQSVSSKALLRGADFKWIAVGCIIPDIPWIFKRIVVAVGFDIDRYLLVQYTSVQASLLFSLVLCGAIALISTSSARTFMVLAMNVFLHLLLDTLQIKWANGVHFFAPFSWQLTQFNFVWPEHAVTYFLTAAGFVTLIYFGTKEWKKNIAITLDVYKYTAAIALLIVYFLTPVLFLSGPFMTNNFFLATLQNSKDRPGKYVEIDRSSFRRNDNTVAIFSTERIRVTGDLPKQDAVLSVKGYFIDEKTIHVTASHVHGPLRDAGSKVGLAGILLLWGLALSKRKIQFEKKD